MFKNSTNKDNLQDISAGLPGREEDRPATPTNSDTWVESRVHTWEFTYIGPMDDIYPFFKQVTGLESMSKCGIRSKWYGECYQGPLGLLCFRSPVTKNQYSEESHWVVPGEISDLMGWKLTAELMRFLIFSGSLAKVTRIDIARDHNFFTVDQFQDQVENHRARCKTYVKSVEGSFRVMKDLTTLNKTVYVGSAKSDRMLRVYNKRGFTRCEMQIRRKWACLAAYEMFSGDEEYFCKAVGTYFEEFINLYEADYDKKKIINKVVNWWQKFIEVSSGVSIKRVITASKITIDNFKKSFKQLQMKFAVGYYMFGEDWLIEQAAAGSNRIRQTRNTHYDIILGCA